MNLPKRISIANLPTRIEKLERFSKELGGPNIYIKRDDQTGTEVSGNKIRKLEFSVKEALDNNCDVLITCGGVQSNHARATAAVAAKLGIKSHIVLKSSTDNPKPDGNLFLDKLLGAAITYVSHDDYVNNREKIMKQIADDLDKEGKKGYIIPEGASNGIGLFGYFKAMEEIIAQEEEMGIKFDAVVVAVGSGGTYGGLFVANKMLGGRSKIYGVNVSADAESFKNRISSVIDESLTYLDVEFEYKKEEINIFDGYVGLGYALSQTEELEFIQNLAKQEGLVLDPVYTGKAMIGLASEIKKGSFKDRENVLFIHTGGLFGLFPKKEDFSF